MLATSVFSAILAFAWLAVVIFVIVRINEISKANKRHQAYLEFLCRHFSPEEFEKYKQNLDNK